VVRRNLTFALECAFFWRTSLYDGVYTPAVIPIRAGVPTAGRHVATAPSVTMTWNASRHTTLSTIFTRFFTGEYFDNLPPERNVIYLSASLSYRF
jgi:hypothetical protein